MRGGSDMDRPYVVTERVPGVSLNELTYRRPEVLEKHKVTIAYQLGMHMAFAYVFGSKDGYQTNYLFDPVDRLLTRIDKEVFLEVPSDPAGTLADGDVYTQEVAACELANLKYIPSFRKKEGRPPILMAFRQGFLDKYDHIKDKKERFLELVDEARAMWKKLKSPEDEGGYHEETGSIRASVTHLIDQDPESVFKRLLTARQEVERGEYTKS